MTEHAHILAGHHAATVAENDPANPSYYRAGFQFRPFEAIELTRLLPFALGNAVKYLIRIGRKDDVKTEAAKIRWYIEDAMSVSKNPKLDAATYAAAMATVNLLEQPQDASDALKLDIIRLLLKGAKTKTRARKVAKALVLLNELTDAIKEETQND